MCPIMSSPAMQAVILIGHSTGCQDAVRYAEIVQGKGSDAAPLAGIVLQAPVSTLETFLRHVCPAVYKCHVCSTICNSAVHRTMNRSDLPWIVCLYFASDTHTSHVCCLPRQPAVLQLHLAWSRYLTLQAEDTCTCFEIKASIPELNSQMERCSSLRSVTGNIKQAKAQQGNG